MKPNRPFTMKKIFLLSLAFIALQACSTSKNSSMKNMMAVMQVDEPIPGVCDNSQVIVILPFPGNGQVKAAAPFTDEEITKKLNEEVPFLEGKSGYNDKGMVGLIVNCKGKMVQCEIDNKTKSTELDQQIVAVFAQMVDWKAGTYHGKPVDTSVLYSFEIKDGVISL